MAPATERESFRPGVVVALPAEARALLGRRRWRRQGDFALTGAAAAQGAQVLWVRSGIGVTRAGEAAALLLEQGVTHLGIVGVSGGLDPALQSGRLVLASEVIDEKGRCWPTAPKLCETLTAGFGVEPCHGPILTGVEPLLTAAAKARWHSSCGALAVDMESAAVARVAAAAGRPFFALRAICDDALRTVPEALFALVDELGRPRFGRLAATLARRPALIVDLLRMQSDFSRALRALQAAFRPERGRLRFDGRED